MLRTFKELKVWQRSYHLCLQVYAVSKRFPADERFGLITQLRRAAVSVSSNTAEGYNPSSRKDYLRFLSIALGSLAELETQLMLSKDLELCGEGEVVELIDNADEVQRMLKALMKSLKE
ncbi:MAG: four helix bundle protein [Phycisphaerae bacterium]|nr:four helix bundle protein [Phycisphaerae bacterium]